MLSPTTIVVQVLNSTYGAAGQIGFRSQFVKSALDRLGLVNFMIARDAVRAEPGVVKVLPFGQFIPRALNAYRMCVQPSFDNRTYDTKLFEWFAGPHVAHRMGEKPNQILLTHLWEYSPKLFDLARKAGARVVVDVPIAPSHETQRLAACGLEEEFTALQINSREDYVLHRADLLLSPSEYVTGTLERMGIPRKRIATVPFGCIVRPAPVARITRQPFTFLFVGTLSRRKGLRFLLDAWGKGPFEHDRLVLCGRVTLMARRLLAGLRDVRNIEMPGHVDIGPYLDMADVFVLPTLMEGSSKAVYEAMGAGLPIITTPNSGTVAEAEQEALIIPPGDSQALVEAMIRLKEDPGLRERLGHHAREKAKLFTWERYGQGVVGAYRDLQG